MRELGTVTPFRADVKAPAGKARQFKMQNANIKLQNGGPSGTEPAAQGAKVGRHFRLQTADW